MKRNAQSQRIAAALLQPNPLLGQSLGQRPATYPLAGFHYSFGGDPDVPNQLQPTGYLNNASQLLDLLKLMRPGQPVR